MHDPLVVAWGIRRPWPQRSSLPATGDPVRWRIRLHHSCGTWCADDPPHKSGSFPWWKPGSYMSHWRLAGRDFYWPPLVTVWHREPGGRDALTVCSRRYQDKAGKWHYSKGWKWHVFHVEWRKPLICVPFLTVIQLPYPVIRQGYHLQFPPLQQLRRRLLTRCAWCGQRDAKGSAVNVSMQWDGPRGRWWQGEPGLYHSECTGRAEADRTCTCDDPLLAGRSSYGRCLLCGRFRPHGLTPERLARARMLQAQPAGQRPAREPAS